VPELKAGLLGDQVVVVAGAVSVGERGDKQIVGLLRDIRAP
jgi:hypothetical protein